MKLMDSNCPDCARITSGDCGKHWAEPIPVDPETGKEVEWLSHFQRLDVKDGDIIVLRYPGPLSPDSAANLTAAVKENVKSFGKDVQVMLLQEDIEIGVLRKENQTMQEPLDDGGAP